MPKKNRYIKSFSWKKKYNNNAVLYQASSTASAEYQKKHFLFNSYSNQKLSNTSNITKVKWLGCNKDA